MPDFKIADASKTASLLKKLVDAADANGDGAIRGREPRGVTAKARAGDRKQLQPGATLDLMRRFAVSRGSAQVKDVKATIDEVARRVRAGDADKNGSISEPELRRLASHSERSFAIFGTMFRGKDVDDFNLPQKREASRPPFRWSGTIGEVTTSLLNAFSERRNDNFWPGYATPSRYVLGAAEATQMVAALKALYATRQRGVLTELSNRTLQSTFGAVAVDAPARKVLEAYASSLGLSGLEFLQPAAPVYST